MSVNRRPQFKTGVGRVIARGFNMSGNGKNDKMEPQTLRQVMR
jgi:hypothetical protein